MGALKNLAVTTAVVLPLVFGAVSADARGNGGAGGGNAPGGCNGPQGCGPDTLVQTRVENNPVINNNPSAASTSNATGGNANAVVQEGAAQGGAANASNGGVNIGGTKIPAVTLGGLINTTVAPVTTNSDETSGVCAADTPNAGQPYYAKKAQYSQGTTVWFVARSTSSEGDKHYYSLAAFKKAACGDDTALNTLAREEYNNSPTLQAAVKQVANCNPNDPFNKTMGIECPTQSAPVAQNYFVPVDPKATQRRPVADKIVVRNLTQ
jgi:hypothetical protein